MKMEFRVLDAFGLREAMRADLAFSGGVDPAARLLLRQLAVGRAEMHLGVRLA